MTRHLLRYALVTASAFLPLARLGAQSADSLAIDSVLLAHVVQQLRSGGDYEPPVRVPPNADSPWATRLYSNLLTRHPDLAVVDSLPPSRTTRGLTLRVDVTGATATSAEAIIVWSRCTPRASFLNYWSHDYRVLLRKEGQGWVVERPHRLAISDGQC